MSVYPHADRSGAASRALFASAMTSVAISPLRRITVTFSGTLTKGLVMTVTWTPLEIAFVNLLPILRLNSAIDGDDMTKLFSARSSISPILSSTRSFPRMV